MTEKQQSLIHYSDMKNIIDTAVKKDATNSHIKDVENMIKLGF